MKKRVAIVYDWIDKWGGVERILLTIKKHFPEVDFFTSYSDIHSASWARDLNIKQSFLKNFPKLIKSNRLLSFIFFPYIFESFDFNGYDLVISITSSFAKSVITKPSTIHICYLLTPPRYLYTHKSDYFTNNFVRFFTKPYINRIIQWDQISSSRPDQIYSISETVRSRCKKFYNRESGVLYPGVDINYWMKIRSKIGKTNRKNYLIVSRLEPYKRIDLAIKAFNQIQEKLVIVGDGSQKKYLKKISGKNIEFFSNISDLDLAKKYLSAHALIMPQEEDFGYVAVEAQIFGCPVVTFKKGGGSETILKDKSGVFFDFQTVNSIIEAIERFDKIKYNLYKFLDKNNTKHLERFDIGFFVNSLKKIIKY